MTPQEKQVDEALAALGISFTRHEHPPVATVDEAKQHWAGIDATHCKNLFLRNRHADRLSLALLGHSKKAELRAVADQIGDGKLPFASRFKILVKAGPRVQSVSPFGLINDRD